MTNTINAETWLENSPQAAALRAARDEAETAAANAQASSRTVGTWTALAALTGSVAGEGAEVLDSDTGTHTDPVVSGTVPNAGRYTWSASPAGWERIGATGLAGKQDAPAPSYSNAGGSGDRTALIDITASSGLFTTSAYSSLIDGDTGTGLSLTPRVSVAGLAITLDFLPGALKVLTEIELTFSNTTLPNMGVWQIRGSRDNVSFEEIGGIFTMGDQSPAVQAITTLAANKKAHRVWQLIGVSGSMPASGLRALREIRLKIADALVTDILPLPSGGLSGQVLTKASSLNGDVEWVETRPLTHTDALVAEYLFNEGYGETVRDIRNGYDITFDGTFRAAYDSDPQWTGQGLRLGDPDQSPFVGDVIYTPSLPSVRTVVLAYRVPPTTALGIMADTSSITGIEPEKILTENEHFACGNGVIATPVWEHSVNAGQYANDMSCYNGGGWVLRFVELDSAVSEVWSLGGRWGNAGQYDGSVYRVAGLDLAYAAFYSDQLTDAERGDIWTSVRRLLLPRGIHLDWRDCVQKCDLVALWGQSNALGRALLADLTAAQMAKVITNSFIRGSTSLATDVLKPGVNIHYESPLTQFGPDLPAAWAHEAAITTRRRPLAISKYAIGGTPLGNTGTVLTWNSRSVPAGLPDSRWFRAVKEFWKMQHELLNRGIGARPRAVWWMQGESDATNATYAADYQTNIQNLWDDTRAAIGVPAMVMGRIRARLTPDTYETDVRSAQAAFDAANSDVTLIDTDGFAAAVDDLHFNYLGQQSLGAAFYAATTLG